MTEQDTNANPQAGEASDKQPLPQAGNPEPQAGDGSTEPISLEAAKKLRSENANLRAREKEQATLLAELKTFKEQTEAAQLSDTEKRDRAFKQRDQQISELQASLSARDLQLQEERNYNALYRAGRTAGIHEETALADAIRLVDTSALEHDDNGKPTNADDLMKQLVKTRPWLTGGTPQQRPQTGGGATQPPRSATSGAQTITKEYVAQVQSGGQQAWNALSPEEQQRISAFIRGGGLFRH